MNLWLDDIRDPNNFGAIGYVWAKTVDEAIKLLETGEVTFASLDHDLSIKATMGDWEKEVTGYDLVCWMEIASIWPVDGVRVHSQNPAGRLRMQAVIDRYYRGW
jgi:hypothetical protein